METAFDDDDSELSDAPPTPGRSVRPPKALSGASSLSTRTPPRSMNVAKGELGEDASFGDSKKKALSKEQYEAKHWVYEEIPERNIFTEDPIVEHGRRRRPPARGSGSLPPAESSPASSSAAVPIVSSSRKKRKGRADMVAQVVVESEASEASEAIAGADAATPPESAPRASLTATLPAPEAELGQQKARTFKRRTMRKDPREETALEKKERQERRAKQTVDSEESDVRSHDPAEEHVVTAQEEKSVAGRGDGDSKSGSFKIRLKRYGRRTSEPTAAHAMAAEEHGHEIEATEEGNESKGGHAVAGLPRKRKRLLRQLSDEDGVQEAGDSGERPSHQRSRRRSAARLREAFDAEGSLNESEKLSKAKEKAKPREEDDGGAFTDDDDDGALSDVVLSDDADDDDGTGGFSDGDGSHHVKGKRGKASTKQGAKEKKTTESRPSAHKSQPRAGSQKMDEEKVRLGMLGTKGESDQPSSSSMLPATNVDAATAPPRPLSSTPNSRPRPAPKVVRRVQSGMMSMLDSLMGSSPKPTPPRPVVARPPPGASGQATTPKSARPTSSAHEHNKTATNAAAQKSSLTPKSSPWSKPIDVKGANGEHVT